ncbi:Ribosomal RNA small subunit methyltransferase F [Porphyromonas levii]|uniref:methyltransferase RsmF C-terminal domain-like protein n=1 Tax=Porphyromonas levii TaxID=28114 RepID=UPI001BADB2EB|nr:RsmB/NOP family class I SAM-dependent RNA methyltransferase [Porphyromonas levii]MBR8783867.1 Ribosomal RNA small subunit methyltransferase F [Porphyromonas levii]
MLQLPERFRERFAQQFGVDELTLLEEALGKPLSPSIRTHSDKGFTPKLRAVPWCALGGYVDSEVTFGADPLWHAGAYYVQEPGSMMVAQYIEQLRLAPQRAIDLCAAPGGKTSLLRNYIPNDCILVANEIESARSRILLENLTRWGLDETIVTSATPRQLKESGITADLILVDAPCSGEGMFRKEPSAVSEWSESNVALCVSRQEEILDEAWAMLEEGGVLIYSTCTYNREENEGQLEYLQSKYSAELLKLEVCPSWGVWEREEGVYHFMPHRTESEGLTIFAVRKIESTVPMSEDFKVSSSTKVPTELAHVFDPENLYQHNGLWYALSREGQALLSLLKRTKILAGGVPLGEEKGKGLVPHQAWANSHNLSALIPYSHYELSKEVALQYLKREVLNIESDRGIQLVTYEGIPLGFAKQVGNRANNLYPKEMMIRNSRLTPEDIPHWN